MPIVDRGGSRKLGDQLAGLLYSIASSTSTSTSTVRRGGLSTRRVQNSNFLAVGCGLNDCSSFRWDFVVLVLSEAVLSEAVLVLGGCS